MPATEDLGTLVVRIEADIKGLQDNLKKSTEQLNQMQANASKMSDGIKGAFDGIKSAALKLGAVLGAGFLFGKFIGDAAEAQANVSQLENVLKSTGSAAGLTKNEITTMASELQKLTKFSDDQILSGQNLLLTFTNIGKDVFPQATETMLDMSTALGQDLKSSAIQLGKALQDPVQGVTALRRVGVNFTESQQEQIKVLVESGRAMEAQKLILRELQTEFGGSAKAAGETFAGKLERVKNQFGELSEIIGGAFLPILSEALGYVLQMMPQIQRAIEIVIVNISSMANGISSFFSGISSRMKSVFGSIGSQSKATADTVKSSHEAEKQAALASVNEQISNAQKLRMVKIGEASKGAAGAKKAYEAEEKSALKSLENQTKALRKNFEEKTDALRKSFDQQRKEADKYYDKTLKDAEKAADREMKIVKDASEEKIKQYDKEYMAKLKAIDTESYNRIKAVQGQIDSINKLTDDEEKAIEEREYNNRVSELQTKINSAKTAEERADYQKDLDDLIAKRQHDLSVASRKQQIESLNTEIDAIKEKTDEKKDLLKQEYDDKKEAEKEKLEATVERLNEEKKITIEKINEEKSKNLEMLETRREVALKNLDEEKEKALSNIDDQKEAMREYYSGLKEGGGGGGAAGAGGGGVANDDTINDLVKQKEEIEKYYNSLIDNEKTNEFQETMDKIKKKFEDLAPILAGVTAGLLAYKLMMLASTIATEGLALAQALLNATMMLNPYAKIAILIGALVAAGVYLYKNWDTVKEKAIELKDKALLKLKEVIDDNKTSLEVVSGILTVVFGPALIKTGIQAGITGAKIALEFTASLIKAGAEAVIAGGKIIASFVASLVKAALEAGLTATVITAQLIAATIVYAAEGYKAAIAIGTQTAAWIANKAQIILATSALIAQKIAAAASIIATQALTAATWLFNVALDANPIGIIIIALAALGVAIYEVVKHWDDITSAIKNAWNWLNKWNNTDVEDKNVTAIGMGDFPGYASGTNFARGGMALVGEQGPELVNLPRGSQVTPNKQTEAMMGSQNFEGMVTGNTFIIRNEADIKALAREFFNLQQSRSRASGVVYGT